MRNMFIKLWHKNLWLIMADNEAKPAHRERKTFIDCCTDGAFSCGHQSMEALWLEFRKMTFHHYNLSISLEMVPHLTNKCRFSSYRAFAWFMKEGLFTVHFSWMFVGKPLPFFYPSFSPHNLLALRKIGTFLLYLPEFCIHQVFDTMNCFLCFLYFVYFHRL